MKYPQVLGVKACLRVTRVTYNLFFWSKRRFFLLLLNFCKTKKDQTTPREFIKSISSKATTCPFLVFITALFYFESLLITTKAFWKFFPCHHRQRTDVLVLLPLLLFIKKKILFALICPSIRARPKHNKMIKFIKQRGGWIMIIMNK